MKKKTKNRRYEPKDTSKKKFWFLQDFGTYSNEMPVFIGYTWQEIVKIMRRKKYKEEAITLFEKDHTDDSDNAYERVQANGGVWRRDGFLVMRFPDFRDDWLWYETLIHECLHATLYALGDQRAFVHSREIIEEEGLAYQQEYLFRNIRRKVQEEYL